MACLISSLQTSKKVVRLQVDRAFHPFIAGANGSQVQAIQAETSTKINFAPLEIQNDKERNLNEIVISGEKEGVAIAEEKIRDLADLYRRSTRTLVLPINKKQHKLVVGAKGANLIDVFEKTGCFVELPSPSDPSDLVTVRGPEASLSTALNLVLEKVAFCESV